MSHRSGLHTGRRRPARGPRFDRDYILAHLDQQLAGSVPDDLQLQQLGLHRRRRGGRRRHGHALGGPGRGDPFGPLGMASSSYRHADYEPADNKALIDVPVGEPKWEAKYVRDADAEAPGRRRQFLGARPGPVDPPAAGQRTAPRAAAHRRAGPADHPRAGVDHGAAAHAGRPHRLLRPGLERELRRPGRLQLGHSGAFNLGAATVVLMLPGEQLGIVVLTNGRPQGIPEAIAAEFFDTAQNGAPTVDWLAVHRRGVPADRGRRPAGGGLFEGAGRSPAGAVP